MILVTICARKNSKRLPNKHMLEFAGRPLASWTMWQGFQWHKNYGAFVVLSTDIPELELAATHEGLSPVHLKICQPDWCAKDDKNPKLNAIRDAHEQAERLFKTRFETIIDLDATNPCRTIEHIEEAYQLFQEKKPPVVFSVTEARRRPDFNQVVIDRWRGPVLPCEHWVIVKDHKPIVYDMNASIYVYSREFLLSGENHPVVAGAVPFEMPGWSSLDIDHEWEFVAMEALFRRYVLEV